MNGSLPDSASSPMASGAAFDNGALVGAKRLMNALIGVVQAHESNYGVLELDFQRRARGMPRPAGAPGRPQ